MHFGGKTKIEIQALLRDLVAAADKRARALCAYRAAEADVVRLRAELSDLVAGSQHHVELHLVETAPAMPIE